MTGSDRMATKAERNRAHLRLCCRWGWALATAGAAGLAGDRDEADVGGEVARGREGAAES